MQAWWSSKSSGWRGVVGVAGEAVAVADMKNKYVMAAQY
jgi:hypothetical protein